MIKYEIMKVKMCKCTTDVWTTIRLMYLNARVCVFKYINIFVLDRISFASDAQAAKHIGISDVRILLPVLYHMLPWTGISDSICAWIIHCAFKTPTTSTRDSYSRRQPPGIDAQRPPATYCPRISVVLCEK